MEKEVITNDEMRELLRPIANHVSYDLVRLIDYAVFSGVGQQYSVEDKKRLLMRVLDQVEFKRKG